MPYPVRDTRGNQPPPRRRRPRSTPSRDTTPVLTHDGHSRTLRHWSIVTGIRFETIVQRYEKGWPAPQILHVGKLARWDIPWFKDGKKKRHEPAAIARAKAERQGRPLPGKARQFKPKYFTPELTGNPTIDARKLQDLAESIRRTERREQAERARKLGKGPEQDIDK
jgi:hypothetical protein